jgi:dihydrofolate synthase/folylpolyglutamate synthase
LISVITNISFDHQSMLGDSLPLIAAEKAGIIKRRIPVVIGERSEETEPVFIRKAKEVGAPIFFAEDLISLTDYTGSAHQLTIDVEVIDQTPLRNLQVELAGQFQLLNIKTVLAALHVLCESTGICLSEESIRKGASQVVSLTRMQGRWQKLKDRPMVIADSGHNPSGLALTMKQLNSIDKGTLRIVFGVSKDKTYDDMLAILPKDAQYYWCAADLPRSLSAHDLMQAGARFALRGREYDSVELALRSAIQDAHIDDFVFVGGSSFVVGETLGLSL